MPLHLLAYYVDPTDAGLAAEMARVRGARDHRGRAHRGAHATPTASTSPGPRCSRYADGGTVGRPHLAQALIRRGLVDTVSEAFVPSMLGRRWRVPKEDTDVFLALRLVLRRGRRAGLRASAGDQARRGRAGLRSSSRWPGRACSGWRPTTRTTRPSNATQVRALAADLGLVVTGSSDFHGSNKTVQLGANLTDPEVFEQIVAAARPS